MKILSLLFVAVLLFSCNDNSISEDTEFIVQQEQIDHVSITWRQGITGNEFGQNVSGDHAGGQGDSRTTIRNVWGNIAESQEMGVGTIIIKHVNDTLSGEQNSLKAIFAMIKREKGYDEANRNWEYLVMKIDALNDNKNGLLPEIGANRGKLQNCINCHSNADGNDYVFTRN